MSSGHGRKKKGGHEEEHENHERWAVSYADMMTVLMALFLVLYAMSSVDQAKFDALRTSLAAGFGQQALPNDGGSGIMEGATGKPVELDKSTPATPTVVSPVTSQASGSAQTGGTGASEGDLQAARAEYSRLEEVRRQIQEALAAAGRSDAATLDITERGLEVVVVSDDVFFANSSDAMQPGGIAVVDAIGPVLAGIDDKIAIEGHTNSLPLTGGPFRSNTGLSAMRASSVLDRFADATGVDRGRMRAVGYGETRPLIPDADPRAVEVNRRVDVVVLSPASAAVKALLPQVADAGPDRPEAAAPARGDVAPASPAGVAAPTNITPGGPAVVPAGAPAPPAEETFDEQ